MNNVAKISPIIERLEIVEAYIKVFNDTIDSFKSIAECQIGHEEKIENDLFFYSFQVTKLTPIPNGVSLMFGTCIHHLRAVCDNLIFAFGDQFHVDNLNGLQFPASNDQSSFQSWRDRHAGFPSQLIDVVKLLQPFTSYRPKDTEYVDSTHPISVLNRLSNIDKHRMILTSRHLPSMRGLRTRDGQGLEFAQMPYLHQGFLDIGTEVARFACFEKIDPGNVHIHVPPQLVIAEKAPLPKVIFPSMFLSQCEEYVRIEVVGKLQPFLQ